ncbi:hypothetical protein IWX48DRAFT_589395 [Phyllosticta citricarpa]
MRVAKWGHYYPYDSEWEEMRKEIRQYELRQPTSLVGYTDDEPSLLLLLLLQHRTHRLPRRLLTDEQTDGKRRWRRQKHVARHAYVGPRDGTTAQAVQDAPHGMSHSLSQSVPHAAITIISPPILLFSALCAALRHVWTSTGESTVPATCSQPTESARPERLDHPDTYLENSSDTERGVTYHRISVAIHVHVGRYQQQQQQPAQTWRASAQPRRSGDNANHIEDGGVGIVVVLCVTSRPTDRAVRQAGSARGAT